MMKKIILTFTLLLLQQLSFAVDFYRIIGARAVALGGTGVIEQSAWSLQNNPAGIATLTGGQLGIYYENQWMLKETAFKSGVMVAKVPRVGNLGLIVNQFGGKSYSETNFGIVYARAFGPYLQMGLEVEYLLLHWSEGYPPRGAPSFSLGVQSQLTEKLRLGACLYNPIPCRLNTLNKDRIPIVLRFGMAYQITDDFVVQCEIERDNDRKGVRIGTGFEYCLFERIHLRAGAQHNPNILSFGFGYRIGKVQVDVSGQMHQLLGGAVVVGIVYEVRGER